MGDSWSLAPFFVFQMALLASVVRTYLRHAADLRSDAARLARGPAVIVPDAGQARESRSETQFLSQLLALESAGGISAADASSLYERGASAALDKLARAMNLFLLSGICGTLVGMLLTVRDSSPRQLPDLAQAFEAFVVTIFGVILTAVTLWLQTSLADRIGRNAHQLALIWPRPHLLTGGAPAPGAPGGVVSQATLEAVEATLRETRELVTGVPALLREQHDQHRVTLEQSMSAYDRTLGAALERFNHSLTEAGAGIRAAIQPREEAEHHLGRHVETLASQVATVGEQTKSFAGVVADVGKSLEAVQEATGAIRQLSNEAAGARGEYDASLKHLREGFEDTIRKTQNEIAALAREIEGIAGKVEAGLANATRQMENALATHVRSYFERLDEALKHFLGQLLDVKTLAPEVAVALEQMRPSAQEAVVALSQARDATVTVVTELQTSLRTFAQETVSALGQSRDASATTVNELRTNLQALSRQAGDVGGAWGKSLATVEQQLAGVGARTQETIRDAGRAIEWTMRMARWVLVPASTLAIGGALWLLARALALSAGD